MDKRATLHKQSPNYGAEFGINARDATTHIHTRSRPGPARLTITVNTHCVWFSANENIGFVSWTSFQTIVTPPALFARRDQSSAEWLLRVRSTHCSQTLTQNWNRYRIHKCISTPPPAQLAPTFAEDLIRQPTENKLYFVSYNMLISVEEANALYTGYTRDMQRRHTLN